jgi:hypothetical protein
VGAHVRQLAFIVAAVALASGAAADPQPITPEVLACGKLGAAWIKQNPLPKNSDGSTILTYTASFFYSSKTNQCWVIKSEVKGGHYRFRTRHLIDAQTGIETMTCFGYIDSSTDQQNPKRDCDYIDKVENGDLASGFMAVPLPANQAAK